MVCRALTAPGTQGGWLRAAGNMVLCKGMATHSNILSWRILWTDNPGRHSSQDHKELDTTEVTLYAQAWDFL